MNSCIRNCPNCKLRVNHQLDQVRGVRATRSRQQWMGLIRYGKKRKRRDNRSDNAKSMPTKDIRTFMSPPRTTGGAAPTSTPPQRRNRIVETDSSDKELPNGNAAVPDVTTVETSDSDDMYVYAPIQPAQAVAPPPQNVARHPDVNPVRSPNQSASARKPVQQRQSVHPPMPQPRSRAQPPKRQRPRAAEADESAGHTSEFSCDESGESAREQYRSSILGVRSRPAALIQVSHHNPLGIQILQPVV
jgi:hypothetical protein